MCEVAGTSVLYSYSYGYINIHVQALYSYSYGYINIHVQALYSYSYDYINIHVQALYSYSYGYINIHVQAVSQHNHQIIKVHAVQYGVLQLRAWSNLAIQLKEITLNNKKLHAVLKHTTVSYSSICGLC